MPGKAQGLLVLSEDERAVLTRWTRRQKSSQALAMRARIVLACADGTPNTHVAEQLGVSRDMVGTWRTRFLARRLEGLSDEPRPGAPRKLTDEMVEAVIVKTLESRPARGDSQWSTRSMAAATGLNQTAVSRIWRAFGLKPHRVDDWKLSTDPQFIEKVRDIVGLYLAIAGPMRAVRTVTVLLWLQGPYRDISARSGDSMSLPRSTVDRSARRHRPSRLH
jgi:transposase